jgi:hypothetical protein
MGFTSFLARVAGEIGSEVDGLRADARALRSFGLVVGGILIAVAVLVLRLYDSALTGILLAIPGALLVSSGIIQPTRLRLAHRAWMALAIALGLIVTPLILSAVYLLIVTPIGIMLRVFGKDPLVKGPDASATSYWIPKAYDSEDRTRLEKYY